MSPKSIRRTLVLLCCLHGLGCSGPRSRPGLDVDWSPEVLDLCGLDPAPDQMLPGPWPDAALGSWLQVLDLDGDRFDELVVTLTAPEAVVHSGFRVYRGGPDGLDPSPWFESWPRGLRYVSGLYNVADADGVAGEELVVHVSGGTKTELQLWSAGGGTLRQRWTVPGVSVAGVHGRGTPQSSLLVATTGATLLYYSAVSGGPADVPDQVLSFPELPRLVALRAVGDFDQDGVEDVVAGDRRRSWLLPGGGLEGEPRPLLERPGLSALPMAGDLDADGLIDLVGAVQRDHGQVLWWPGADHDADAGGLLAVQDPEGERRVWEVGLAPAPNGDGDTTLLLGARTTEVEGAEYAGIIAVHASGPEGPEPTPFRVLRAHGPGCVYGMVFGVGDFNGDGLADIAATLSTDTPAGRNANAVAILLGPRWSD